ncbi:MAG: CHASE domain-containing protein [Magnetococcales bacterium]|nr:CHASE domain-containing protein [Magnetococcales bacterium]
MTQKELIIRKAMVVVLVGGVLVSLAGAYVAHALLLEIHRQEFEKDASERFEAILSGIHQYLDIVEDIRGLFVASHHVDREEFAAYVRPILARKKGFQAISWNSRVKNEERLDFEKMTSQEFPGFRILERREQNRMIPANVRDEYVVVNYLEPLSGNEKVFGFDVASDPMRWETFEKAMESGMTAVTSRIRLVQESSNQHGALFVHPIYVNGQDVSTPEARRTHLQGFAVGVVRFGDLIEHAMAALSPRGITFWLHDVSFSQQEDLLYCHITRMDRTHPESDPYAPTGIGTLSLTKTFPVANRLWRFTAIHHHDVTLGVHNFFLGVLTVPGIGFMLTWTFFEFLRRMLRDEHSRQTWEMALRSSDELQRTIIRSAPFGIVVADGMGKILEFNTACQRLFGYDRDAILGEDVVILVPPELKQSHKAGFHHYRVTEEAKILGHPPFETAALRRDGVVFPIRLAVDRVVMDQRFVFLGVIIDMTEEKRLLSELIQSEKMAALGNMVTGVAHEINTPVGIGVTASSELEDRIQSFVALLEREGISEEELSEHIAFTARMAGLIRGNLERAADLVRNFKAVAVDRSGEMVRTFMVRACVESAVKTLYHELRGTRLEVTIECPEDLVMRGHPGAISQIVINLVNNSHIHGYAPDADGRIVMKFSVVGELLYFNYSDDGSGMSEEVQQRIFEPFFTTRRNQGGTGLGMHVVYNLVTQTLNGSIHCHSMIGKGTHFLIRVPLGMNNDQSA